MYVVRTKSYEMHLKTYFNFYKCFCAAKAPALNRRECNELDGLLHWSFTVELPFKTNKKEWRWVKN